MANPYYESGAGRARKVRALFARIAGRYDLLNDLQSFGLHRRWKARVVRISGAGPGRKTLDVCCGTGDIAFSLAAVGAEVTALDFSEQMLGVARVRLVKKPPQIPVTFLQGDAQNLPFPDDSFDAVTVGYGLRNLAEWERGLREMHRVAKPGGRVVVLDFGKPDNAIWRALYFSYLRVFVPLLGLAAAGSASAYSYILESLANYPAQHGVDRVMRQLRMRPAEIIPILGGAMTINAATKN